jgi:tRNA U34 2-thiouridine synthase MnmA/TrmU
MCAHGAGVHMLTRGQRVRLSNTVDNQLTRRYFVCDINMVSNDVYVVCFPSSMSDSVCFQCTHTHHPALYNQQFTCTHVNWLSEVHRARVMRGEDTKCAVISQRVHPHCYARYSTH